MPNTPHKEIIIEKVTGSQTLRVDRDTHTLVLDLNHMAKAAIGDFVKEVVRNPHTGFRPTDVSDIVGLAIGKFDVPLDSIYDGTVESLDKLDDRTLAQIFRHREERNRSSE